MAEKKSGNWKFREGNRTTGRAYFDFVPGGKPKYVPEEALVGLPPTAEKPIESPLTPKERGNFTADIDSAAAEKRDEQKEAVKRKVMGLPPED